MDQDRKVKETISGDVAEDYELLMNTMQVGIMIFTLR